MNYSAINTQAIQIQSVSSGGTGEITINLNLTNPNIVVKKSSYISGVYDTSGNLNPKPPYCEIDDNNSIILNNVKSISATEDGEVTLKLNTKFKQL